VPLNPLSLARIADLHPHVFAKAKELASVLEAGGVVIAIVQGGRTWALQDQLFQQGRTTPGAKVTNAPAGHSWHNFYLAFDAAPVDQDTKAVDWNSSHPVWAQMETAARSLGFVCGADWRTFPDKPHFQMTGSLPVSPDDNVRAIYNQGGLRAVWEATGLPLDQDS
jgi:peptidoglycan LD-endopeptidase CwlK